MGFEPTRAEHIGLAVQRLNHSATSSLTIGSLVKVEIQVLFPKQQRNPECASAANDSSIQCLHNDVLRNELGNELSELGSELRNELSELRNELRYELKNGLK